jgi:transposase-like protein
MPDPEVRERPVRRRFTAEYKRRIVEEASAAGPGAVGALLRREGLYSSHPLAAENDRLRAAIERLEAQLIRAEEDAARCLACSPI